MSSSAIATQAVNEPDHCAVAPAWHTAVIVLVVLGASLAGALHQNLSPIGHAQGRVGGYVIVMLFEWALVAFIWWGVKRRGLSLNDLVGGRWTRVSEFFRDLGIAIGFLLVNGVILSAIGHLLKASHNQAMKNLLPEGPVEIVVYLLVCATAGFCEELIFRGYLQRQFAVLTKAPAGGIALQAIVFGFGHGYQGWKYMLIIIVFGAMFGLLAHWLRSLRPGMLAHFVQDGVGGLLGRHLMR